MMKHDRSLAGVARDLWGSPAEPEVQHDTAIKANTPAQPAWRGVDEDIEWTELLACGGKHPLAAYAPAVLAGDCDAYRAVLTAVNPLAELAPHTTHCTVDVSDADTAAVRFAATVPAEERTLASSMALRAARDVLSVLPVTTVQVEACFADGWVLRAAYTREQLRSVRINTADPAALAEACGKWTKEEPNAHHCADTE